MAFEIKRTGAAEYGRFIKAFIAGDPGAGKTRFGRSWPNPFYVSAEGRMMSIAADSIRYADVTSTSELKEVLVALKQPPDVRERLFGGQVETLVVDTTDEIQRILVRERLKTEKRDAMQQGDWGWLGDKLRAILRAFRNLPMHVILTAHIKEISDDESGRVTVVPQIQGAVGGEIAGYVDLSLLALAEPIVRVEDGDTVRDIRRFLQTYKDRRYPWIKDHSGRLPQEFEVNFEDDFQRMYDAIYGGLQLPESTTVEVSTVVASAAPAAPQEPTTESAEEAPAADETTTQPAASATSAADAAEPATSAVDQVPDEAKETVTALEKEFGAVDVVPPDPEPYEEPKKQAKKEVKDDTGPADTQLALDGEPDEEGEAVAPKTEPVESEFPPCEGCGGVIAKQSDFDISKLRFKKPMCVDCFKQKKTTTKK